MDNITQTATIQIKTGFAEMFKGGVIMDVVTPDQARIAEAPARPPSWHWNAFLPTSARTAAWPA